MYHTDACVELIDREQARIIVEYEERVQELGKLLPAEQQVEGMDKLRQTFATVMTECRKILLNPSPRAQE